MYVCVYVYVKSELQNNSGRQDAGEVIWANAQLEAMPA